MVRTTKKTTKKKFIIKKPPAPEGTKKKARAKKKPEQLALTLPGGTPTPPPAMDGVVLKVCRLPLCKQYVGPFGYQGLFCSMTCFIRNRTRNANSAAARVKYKPEYANAVFWEYVRECEHSHNPQYVKQGDSMIPIKRVMTPSLAGYATYLGRAKATLKVWTSTYDEFRSAMLMLKQIQEMYLTNNGLNGIYNPHITKMLLMNNHGMKDRSERTNVHTFGIVREVYEAADAIEAEGMIEDPFEGEDDTEADRLV